MTRLQVEIEKGRLESERLQQEIKADGRKFAVQAGLTIAACVSAGVAVGAYLLPSRPAPQPPQIVIIQAPPGTTATVLSPGMTAPSVPAPPAK